MVARMQDERNFHRFDTVRAAFHLLASCAILVGVAYPQTTQNLNENSPHGKTLEVISGLRTGDFGPATEQQVLDARAGQLVPMLEARFAATQDAELKARIASALVRLGDLNDAYWNELVQQAAPAANSDAPDPRCLGAAEHCGSGASPEYTAWAKAHNVVAGSQAETALLELPTKLERMASTGDPRGIPLLRLALRSPNYEIESAAAEGLAEARDKDSIPLIIEACKRAPADIVQLLAEYLRWFDDPLAQSVADAYVPKAPDPVEALQGGNFTPVFIEKVAAAHDLRAVPILKEQFKRSQDTIMKAHIASALVRLGEADETYWDFLVEQAKGAVENGAPSVAAFDPQGKPKGTSPEFITWAKTHASSVASAKADAMIWLPQRVLFLALTGDSRAAPLLRRGLSSPNFMIQADAATGLAKLQDKDSVPLIIEACKNAPAEPASTIAKALVYFDDPQAQKAVDKYIPKEYASALRAARVRGMTPFHD
jgi:hypothetical protein